MRPLIHIGYHKTATTWLQRSVFVSRDAGFALAGSSRDLPSYFANIHSFAFDPTAARDKFGPRVERAEEEGLVPALSAERLSGDPHRGGFDGKLVADRLAETFPEARVLVVFREQGSMLYSLYKQYMKRGGGCLVRAIRQRVGSALPLRTS